MAPPPRRVTLRDVAEAAGVHVSTVSRVLNAETRGLVKDATASRIEAVVEELGYSPNRLAQGLKTRRSMTVGVIVNDITNPVFPYVIRGIEDRLLPSGYTALVTNTDADIERERAAFETLRSRQVDGFIMATPLRVDPLVDEALDEGVPLVLVVRNIDSHRAAAVTSDERIGVRTAVEHLHGLGHRAMACISGPPTVSNGAARLAGFKEAMAARRLEMDPKLIVEAAAFTIAEGERATRELLDGGAPFTAVVAGNDLLAVGCLAVIGERGLRCPDDVSVIGFNDMPMADRLSPPLTTLRVPYYNLGIYAAELFLEQLRGRQTREITVVQDLVPRGSTGPAPS